MSSGRFIAFEQKDIEQSIVARFEHQVARRPHAIAIESDECSISYRELDQHANHIARELLRGLGRNAEPVAILFDQGVASIAAILGVLKSGKFYVPLNPYQPPQRSGGMLAASGAKLILTDSKRADLAGDLAADGVEVVSLDALEVRSSSDRVDVPIAPDALAYIFFTSGSTGEPKGVYDTHRNVLHNILRYTNTLCIDCDDRLTLLQSCGFSGTVSSLFAALLNGACVMPFDLQSQTPATLANWLERRRPTVYHSVPAILRSVLAAGQQRFDDVRVVRLEGDSAASRDIELCRQRFSPRCLVVNGLGMTEAGLVAQHFIDGEYVPSGNAVPVGHAVPGMQVFVLVNGESAAANQVGEIAVRSRYLAPGYWNRPDLTRERFFGSSNEARTYLTGDLGRIRTDGCLEHLGRLDSRVKIRGHNVELAEVEAALTNLHPVAEAAVAVTDDRYEPELLAYIVPSAQPPPTVSALRRALAKSLPVYMIPTKYKILTALPRNPAGKLERHNLPRLEHRRPRLDRDFIQQRNLLELRLTQIWEDVLKVKPVGVTDDFFDLGGHSLVAVQMMDRIEHEFDLRLSPSTLLSNATIEHLANELLARSTDTAPLVTLRSHGRRSPLYFFHGDYLAGGLFCRYLVKQLDDDQPLFVISPRVVNGQDSLPSYADMAREHLSALRAQQSHGPYRLAGVCNGGLVAFETARLLEQDGETVDRLILVRASASNIRFAKLHRRVDRIARWVGARRAARKALFFRLRRLTLVLERLPMHKRLGLLIAVTAKLPARLWSSPGVGRQPDAVSTTGSPGTEILYRRIDDAYIPPRYTGHITLLWWQDEQESPEEAAAWWRRLGATVDLHVLPGLHTDAITKNTSQFAKVLQRCLDE